MKELKCPKCGNVFLVDESDYAAILSQVRNQEFESEIKLRLNDIQKQNEAQQETATLKITQDFQGKLTQKDIELSKKEGEIERLK